MNPADLKFLADRASSIDGHRVDRLTELHARIRKARRRRVVGVAGGLTLAMILGGAAIGRSSPVDQAVVPADRDAASCTASTYASANDRVGFLGLPPTGATPSATTRTELVLHYFGADSGDGGIGKSHVWVYADGRLIVKREACMLEGATSVQTGYLERSLTPWGVKAIRSYVVSNGLPLDSPPPYPTWLRVRKGDRMVDFDPFANIDRARLIEPESWLPARAWADSKIRAYVPSRIAVCYSGGHRPVPQAAILDSLPAAAADLLRAKTATRVELPDPSGRGVCSVVTTEEARPIVEALQLAWFEKRDVDTPFVMDIGLIRKATPGAEDAENAGSISFDPVLPNGDWPCSNCG